MTKKGGVKKRKKGKKRVIKGQKKGRVKKTKKKKKRKWQGQYSQFRKKEDKKRNVSKQNRNLLENNAVQVQEISTR